MSGHRVIVVGAGHAGGTFTALLRRAGFDGEVVLLGTEQALPYHRPPLSKSFRSDEETKFLYESGFYADNDILTRLGETVLRIDRPNAEVHLSSGECLSYDHLVLATGAEPRQLPIPGADLAGIHTLRTAADAQSLRSSIQESGSLAIIGGGYVGLEVAAAARQCGIEVTVLEREHRLLARVASPDLSELLTRHHRREGIRILTGAQVTGFLADQDHVVGVTLADGTEVHGNTVLVGAGANPRDELASQAGLACDNGILVDDRAQTSDPRILAIGDATNRPVASGDITTMRLESIPSAVEQAKQAVATIMSQSPVEPEIPWFWSDQFDLKIKIAGILTGSYGTVLRGDPDTGSYALYHHRNSRIVAVETVNAPRDFMAAKQLLAQDIPVHPVDLADPHTNLREILTPKAAL